MCRCCSTVYAFQPCGRLQVFFFILFYGWLPKPRGFSEMPRISTECLCFYYFRRHSLPLLAYMPLTSNKHRFILPPCVPKLHNVVQRTRDQLMLMGRWPLHRCHPACVRGQRQENQGAIWIERGKHTDFSRCWNQHFEGVYKIQCDCSSS